MLLGTTITNTGVGFAVKVGIVVRVNVGVNVLLGVTEGVSVGVKVRVGLGVKVFVDMDVRDGVRVSVSVAVEVNEGIGVSIGVSVVIFVRVAIGEGDGKMVSMIALPSGETTIIVSNDRNKAISSAAQPRDERLPPDLRGLRGPIRPDLNKTKRRSLVNRKARMP